MTHVQLRTTLPIGAHHEADVDGNPVEVWAKTPSGYALLRASSPSTAVIVGTSMEGAIPDVLQREGWRPLNLAVEDPEAMDVGWPDEWHLTWSRVWRYWITAPDTLLAGVKQFVAAAEAGGLPDDWAEQGAEDDAGTPHTVCSFSMTMDQARALGAEQEALMSLASLPDGVHFFQAVSHIGGFLGVEKESRQPDDTLPVQLYEPEHLFQASHPDAGERRGTQWGEQNVFDTTGLTLL